jgi:hypothetical protein
VGVRGGEVVFQLIETLGSDDDAGDYWFGQEPGE